MLNFGQFSPVGHYFASASHDRTARIWSMDRIQPLRIMAGHLSDVDVSLLDMFFDARYLSNLTEEKIVFFCPLSRLGSEPLHGCTPYLQSAWPILAPWN